MRPSRSYRGRDGKADPFETKGKAAANAQGRGNKVGVKAKTISAAAMMKRQEEMEQEQFRTARHITERASQAAKSGASTEAASTSSSAVSSTSSASHSTSFACSICSIPVVATVSPAVPASTHAPIPAALIPYNIISPVSIRTAGKIPDNGNFTPICPPRSIYPAPLVSINISSTPPVTVPKSGITGLFEDDEVETRRSRKERDLQNHATTVMFNTAFGSSKGWGGTTFGKYTGMNPQTRKQLKNSAAKQRKNDRWEEKQREIREKQCRELGVTIPTTTRSKTNIYHPARGQDRYVWANLEIADMRRMPTLLQCGLHLWASDTLHKPDCGNPYVYSGISMRGLGVIQERQLDVVDTVRKFYHSVRGDEDLGCCSQETLRELKSTAKTANHPIAKLPEPILKLIGRYYESRSNDVNWTVDKLHRCINAVSHEYTRSVTTGVDEFELTAKERMQLYLYWWPRMTVRVSKDEETTEPTTVATHYIEQMVVCTRLMLDVENDVLLANCEKKRAIAFIYMLVMLIRKLSS